MAEAQKYTFGKRSLKAYKTIHPDLQKILDEAIKLYDFSIISGKRTAKEQNELFKLRRSKLDGYKKKSKHQSGKAVDIMPYKKGTNAFSSRLTDTFRFYYMMGIIKTVAERLDIKIRLGMDWDSDDIYSDQNFHDLPHFELI